MFYKINEDFNIKTKNKFEINKNIKDYDLIILNRKWIDEFKYIYHYDEILPLIINNKEIIKKERDDKIDEIIYKISNELLNDTKIYLQTLEEKAIKEKLNNKNLYKLCNNKYKMEENNEFIYYFDKCGFFTQNYYDLLKNNQNLDINMYNYKCNFIDGKIIIYDESLKMVNIGIYNEFDYLFVLETIIISSIPENIKIISENVKLFGYQFIEELIKENEDNLIINEPKIIIIKLSKLINIKELAI